MGRVYCGYIPTTALQRYELFERLVEVQRSSATILRTWGREKEAQRAEGYAARIRLMLDDPEFALALEAKAQAAASVNVYSEIAGLHERAAAIQDRTAWRHDDVAYALDLEGRLERAADSRLRARRARAYAENERDRASVALLMT